MLFNSFTFLLFFPLVILLFYLIRQSRYQKLVLITASVFFILYSSPFSLLIISIISILNYFIGIQIGKKENSFIGKTYFILGIFLNIANLFFFKYFNFFISNVNNLSDALGFIQKFPQFNLILPLGISFYTFSALSYLIDIKLENISAERNLTSFVSYIFFFPKLLAGPIERAQSFLPQINVAKGISTSNFSEGVKLIIWGFFQKLVVADRIAIYVNSIDPHYHSGKTILLSSVLYTFQVYADFSGYTDIARGLAKILGFNLMENFKRPLFSVSITDFWRRWHISLSSWVNEYIYNPLALQLRNYGKKGIILALFISFVIVGIWHGATWTFVIFGIIQGIVISIELLSLKWRRNVFKRIPDYLAVFLGLLFSFSTITLSLILFRALSIEQASEIIKMIFNPAGKIYYGSASFILYSLFGILIIILRDIFIEFKQYDIFIIPSRFFIIRSFLYGILLISILLIGVFDGSQFIYFQF